MAKFTAYILFVVFAIIFSISQSNDDCFYNPGHLGKKCFDENNAKYTCCPLDHQCQKGKCTSLNAPSSMNDIPVHTYILIGVGVTVFAIVCIVIGALYWHRRQMNKTESRYNPFSSYSQSSSGSSRDVSSVGFRIRTSPSQPSKIVASVNIETSTTIKP